MNNIPRILRLIVKRFGLVAFASFFLVIGGAQGILHLAPLHAQTVQSTPSLIAQAQSAKKAPSNTVLDWNKTAQAVVLALRSDDGADQKIEYQAPPRNRHLATDTTAFCPDSVAPTDLKVDGVYY
jgi:hypothetical protein